MITKAHMERKIEDMKINEAKDWVKEKMVNLGKNKRRN